MENLAEDPSQTLERNNQGISFQNPDSDNFSLIAFWKKKNFGLRSVVEKLCPPSRVGWGGGKFFFSINMSPLQGF
jgi:hypothetical protein